MAKISTTLLAICAGLSVASLASAGDDAAKKKAPEAKPADAKPAPPKDEPVAADPMAMPDPAPELAALGKTLQGTWRCKGTDTSPEGKSITLTATIKYKLDVDKFWLKSEVSVPKQKGMKRGYKDVTYRTYSSADKKWHAVGIDNMGGWSKGWSTGPDAAGKVTWENEGVSMGQMMKSRNYEEPVAGKKKAIHMWGEWSMDGKTWNKSYDVTCTK